MAHVNDQASSEALLPGRTSDNGLNIGNHAPTHKALSPSHKQRQTKSEFEDVDHQLGVLKELRISNSTGQLVDNKVGYHEDDTHDDKHRPSHHDGNEDLLHEEHAAVYTYFFENCPVAGELQELRRKVINHRAL